MLRPALVVVALLLVGVLLAWPRPRLNRLSGSTMGTTYTVKYVVRCCPFLRHEDLDQLAGEIKTCLDDVNGKMSTYLPDSELSRFNAHGNDSPFRVSASTLEVFQCAHEVSRMTAGAFDITVGPAVNAYGFGPEPDRPELPDENELAALRERIGYRMVEIDPVAIALRKQRPDIYCDLSALAKGYAVDQVAELLEARGIDGYMVEIGGEIRTRGKTVKGHAWRIAIEQPAAGARSAHSIINLADASLATSGDYRNYYVKDGQRLSHTIDPRTAMPVTHNLASVSVIHDQCVLADAWATALMVLGPREGYELAESRGIAALFLIRQSDDTITEKATSAFTVAVNSE